MMNFDVTEEQRLLEQSIREWGAREVSPKIRDLDEIHTLMQADYVLGFRQDKPLRCELPKCE